MAKARIMFFDIEATSLNASFGRLICMGYQFRGKKKVHCPTIYDYPAREGEPKDAGLCRHIHGLLTHNADIIVSWYGKEYDRKFLNTRMLIAGLPPLPPLNSEHIDLYYTARYHFKFHNNRLQGVSESLRCPYGKTPLSAAVWMDAQDGDRKAVNYVVEHCKHDVLILGWLYEKFRPYIRTHPPVSGEPDACRNCGNMDFRKNGYGYGAKGKVPIRQCLGCGTYRRG